jgi:nucleoside-diphosphate-sugar epimerase/pimeloyl-ACP methyl ester carboxylesterase
MKYFVTGATGFIGSHFVADQAGEHQIVALVRAESPAAARSRLTVQLRTAADAYSPALEVDHSSIDCVTGDVGLPFLGVTPEVRHELAAEKVDIFWHLAADLNFEKHKAERLMKVNVEGVRRAMDFAMEISAKRFVYVSTAYTAGTATGTMPEELHSTDGPFGNSYEQSKCLAEHLVAGYLREHGMAFSILRPSVIIGVSDTKRSGGASTGMYAFIRDLYLLRQALANLDVELNFQANPKMTVNFNPIDGMLADIRYLIANGFAGGPIYHLTASLGVTLESAFELVESELGITGFRVKSEANEIRTPLDELIGKRAEFYRSYVFNEKEFTRSIPLRHGCSRLDLPGYVRSFIAELDAEFADTGIAAEPISTSDGVVVTGYRTPPTPATRPALLICTAFGIPVDLWRSFIKRAASRYDVFVWDTRYLPGTAPLESTDISVARHCQDGVEVLDHFGVERAHIIGWCTGAKIALRIAAENPDRVCSLTLLSGGYNITDDALRTPYETDLTDVLSEIAADRELADVYYDLIYRGSDDDIESDGAVRTFLNDTNPDYIQFTSLPFQSADSIYRYARLITTFAMDTATDYIAGVTTPTLTIAARTDGNTHPDASRYVANTVCAGRCVELAEGDHYLMDSRSEHVFAEFDAHALATSEKKVELI